MKHKKVKLIAVIIAQLALTGLHAQTAVPAAGGEATGGGSASYSVGQIVYSSNTGTNGTVAEGAQQPYEIFVVTAIEGTKDIKLTISAYPNPTTDYLILNVHYYDSSKLDYQLYDLSGKLLINRRITSSQTIIEMNKLASASYILKVTIENKEVKTFKIIKK